MGAPFRREHSSHHDDVDDDVAQRGDEACLQDDDVGDLQRCGSHSQQLEDDCPCSQQLVRLKSVALTQNDSCVV